MTKVIDCSCVHAYQDKRYGVGKRLANNAGGTKGAKGWRCTVCAKMK